MRIYGYVVTVCEQKLWHISSTSLNVWYIHNFLGYRSIWYMNESLLSQRTCMHMSFMLTHVQYETLWLGGLVSCAWSTVSCNMSLVIFSAIAVSTCNSWTVCRLMQYTWSLVVTSKEIITGIHVWWIWWPGPPTPTVLWKLIWQDKATKHIMQDIQGDIYCMWVCAILLEKCCVHMPCSLNEWNDLMLQLLQVPLVWHPPQRPGRQDSSVV